MAEKIRELEAGSVSDPRFFRETLIDSCLPVVVRGMIADWPSVKAGRTSAAAFAAYLSEYDAGCDVGVFVAPAALAGRYYYSDGLAGLNFERSMLPFRKALELIAANCVNDGQNTAYVGSILLDECLPGFAQNNPAPHALLDESGRLWLGNPSNVAMHYDAMDNLACVIAGQRRFSLYAPEHISKLYVGPIDNTMAGRPVSMAATENDPAKYPAFEAIRDEAMLAELGPGDAIYIPKLWWHQVESLSPLNGMVNYWWDAFSPGPDEPYTAMLLSLITIAERPAAERAAWRAYFDHYVFRPEGHPLAHLPPQQHGVLGALESNYGRIRAAVLNLLRSPGGR